MSDARSKVSLVAPIIAAWLLAATVASDGAGERFWPQWRGPHATGVSRHATPPVEWSETKNVRWKVEIPGRGSSSPVVWGDHLFLLSAVPVGVVGPGSHQSRSAIQPRDVHRYTVLAIDRRTGRVLWERTAREERPRAPSMKDGTWASSSAITDGSRVFAFFESSGLYAYDMNGSPLWQKHFGDKQMFAEVGESGSTPALYGDRLVVVWDHRGESFIVTLDARTGAELWRRSRDEVDSWPTPLVVTHERRAQVVTAAEKRLRSYDLETGDIVWESDGLTMNPIPSPVAEGGMVFAMSGFKGNRLSAIRLADARGDISGGKAVAWTLDRDTPYVPSPLLYEGVLYFLKNNAGILSAFDATSGRPHYQAQRIDGIPEVYSSPVAAQGRVYITGRDGTTVVLRHGSTLEVLARNTLDDGFDASAALVDGHIYLRGVPLSVRHIGTLSGLELSYVSLEREDLCHCCDRPRPLERVGATQSRYRLRKLELQARAERPVDAGLAWLRCRARLGVVICCGLR
jgi:outer membrane protein assembly factor BamB